LNRGGGSGCPARGRHVVLCGSDFLQQVRRENASVARRAQAGRRLGLDAAAAFAVAAHAHGDFNVTGKGHHGTPDERAAAVVRGFEVTYRERRLFQEAIRVGVKYVSAL